MVWCVGTTPDAPSAQHPEEDCLISRSRQRNRLLRTAPILALTLSGCGTLDAMRPMTSQGEAILTLFNVSLIASAVVFLLVCGALAVALIRSRQRLTDEEPAQVHGNRRLETGWTAAAALLIGALFVGAVWTMATVDASAPAPATRVRVIGHQWWWEYQYPELGVSSVNELHLPVGEPVEIAIEAADVIHSFWIPRVGWKKDAIPGKSNVITATPLEVGIYDGACAEYCGTQHAWMRVRLFVTSRADFDQWVAARQRPAGEPTDEAARRGRMLFMSNTCINCHTIRGTPADGTVGPDLTHVGSRTILGAGVIDNTLPNMRAWIENAGEIKPGVLMPQYTSFSDEELDALAIYMESLR